MISSLTCRSSRSLIVGAFTRLSNRTCFKERIFSIEKHDFISLHQSRRMLTSNAKPNSSTKQSLDNEAGNGSHSSGLLQMWNRFIGPKTMPPRWTPGWYSEMVLICTVFAITGSSTMVLVSDEIYFF